MTVIPALHSHFPRSSRLIPFALILIAFTSQALAQTPAGERFLEAARMRRDKQLAAEEAERQKLPSKVIRRVALMGLKLSKTNSKDDEAIRRAGKEIEELSIELSRHNTPWIRAEVIYIWAQYCISVRRNDEALRAMKQYYEAVSLLPNKTRQAFAKYQIGTILNQKHKPTEALPELNLAAEIATSINDIILLYSINWELSTTLRRLARHDAALEKIELAERTAVALRIENGVHPLNFSRAEIEIDRHDPRLALQYLNKIDIEIQKPTTRAAILHAKSKAHFLTGNFSATEEHLDHATEVLDSVPDEKMILRIQLSRARLLAVTGRLNDALDSLHHASRQIEKIRDKSAIIGFINMTFGEIHDFINNDNEALHYYSAALNDFKKTQLHSEAATVLWRRGQLLALQGDFDRATSDISAAKKLVSATPQSGLSKQIIATEGLISLLRGDYSIALPKLRRAATAFRALNRPSAAAAVEADVARTLFAQGKYRDAIDVAKVTYKNLAKNTPSRPGMWIIPTVIGDCYAKLGDSKDAVNYYLSALSEIESYHKSQVQHIGLRPSRMFRNRVPRLHHKIADIQPHENHREDFKKFVFRALQSISGQSTVEITNRRAQRAIAGKTKRQKHSIPTRSNFLDATMADISNNLPETAILVELSIHKHQIIVFIHVGESKKSRLLIFRTPENIERYSQMIREHYRDGSNNDPSFDAIYKISHAIAHPIFKEIHDLYAQRPNQKPKKLIFALHGSASSIPMEVLTIDTNQRKIIDSYDVSYVPSGAAFVAMLKQRDKARTASTPARLVGFGFPGNSQAETAVGHTGASPAKKTTLSGLFPRRAERVFLEGAWQELLSVARVFTTNEIETKRIDHAERILLEHPFLDSETADRIEGNRFLIKLRSKAQETAFKNDVVGQFATAIHFAGHGESHPTTPALSRLVFAQNEKMPIDHTEDGFLYLEELMNLDISTELLALSACETNDGVVDNSEGIHGLAWAGLMAGARSVLSTRWRVDDDEARDLVVDFYRRWIKEGKTRIRALSEAKRAAIKRGAKMRNWAGYVLWDADVGPREPETTESGSRK